MARKKRIRFLSVRLTTDDAAALRKLARASGCSESTFVRDLLHVEMRHRGMLAPLGTESSQPDRMEPYRE